jgi:putative membrane protein
MKMFRLFYYLLILLLLFSLNIYASGDFCPFFGWPNMPNMMRWGWGGMFMGLLFLLIIGLIIYLIVKSVRTTKPEAISKEETALEILKIRYAKGEINKEEYDRIKKDLKD